MGDVAIINTSTTTEPKDYTLSGSQELLVKAVRAVVDGSGAASEFLPVLQLLAPDGTVMWEGFPATTTAAGGSADVSWFPRVGCCAPSNEADFNAAAVALGPWAYWRMSEAAGSTDIIDYSGHARTIHPDNSVTLGVSPGLVATESWTTSSSPQIAVSNQYNFRSNSNQTFGSATATCVAYLNTNGNGVHEMNFSCMGTIGAPTSFSWRTYLTGAGQFAVQYQGTDSASHAVTFAAGPTLGTNTQVAVVIDGTNLRCYMDGVLVDTQAQPIAMVSTLTAEVFVGQPLGGAGVRWYAGELGPVLWFDKALTASEIANLYNQGTGGASGAGGVASVTAGDASISVGGTATDVTVETASLDVIASLHATAADWSNNSHKITSVTDPTAAQDAATKNYVDTHAGVSSVFGRSGAVVAANGDYEGVVASALTGATQATRYVGATASGAPVSGTFAKGDFVVAQDGHLFVCTTAGTPGTWTDVGSGGAVSSVFGRTGAVVAVSGDYTLNQIGNATADYSINSHKLTNVTDPGNAQDAATKNYVDTTTGGTGGTPGTGWTIVSKGADEDRTSTVTPTADAALAFTAASNSFYRWMLAAIYLSPVGGTTPNIRFAFGENSDVDHGMAWGAVRNTAGNTATATPVSTNQVNAVIAQTQTTNRTVMLEGYCLGQGGSFQVLWAQGTSSANKTTLKAGSLLAYAKLS